MTLNYISLKINFVRCLINSGKHFSSSWFHLFNLSFYLNLVKVCTDLGCWCAELLRKEMSSLDSVTLLLLTAFHLLILLCFSASQPPLWEPLSSSVARCHQVALLQHYETQEAIPKAPA